ncbi:MAG: head-tail adaptor Ad1 (endogenous virus) [Lactobacillus phage ViSo-2018a]|uniref:Uncharacterized protein n=1 Tax=Lactobacillus phage ViSo-2018a TaxID=2267607 RepID=A0A3G6JGS7_9CAUD|nr:MAG: head-tail adaptor Ad1 [Lactobacillus phage ViSo-2018a]AZA17275.1 MAG: hypothetical protein DQL93_0480 [Lactobacillus phage ViSo-2018a]
MSVILKDFKNQLNADDYGSDEDKYLQSLLDSAQVYVKSYLQAEDLQYKPSEIEKISDELVLQMATHFYLNRDGVSTETQKRTGSQLYRGSFDTIADYFRKPEI